MSLLARSWQACWEEPTAAHKSVQEGSAAYHRELMHAVGQRGSAFYSVQTLGSSSSIIRQRAVDENADDRVPATASHT